ncbi:MAG TPA: TIGR00303 family protein [Candidatus Nanoarchaeia archaeon]|nr:TIGR00303 family protein [Candidatus Nanoarchaeia archaeon]
MQDIIFAQDQTKGETFLNKIVGKKPLFTCTFGTTETAKISGISAAGANPEITDYTPPADIELLMLGKCECINGVPVTPDGIPTPALITASALKLAKIPALPVNAGVRILPHVPFLELGGKPGKDIRTGKAVENALEVMQRAKLAGQVLSQTVDYLVIGESIPGGTTTALGVLIAMGVNAEGKVSSSMPGNPHDLKIKTVKEGLKQLNIKPGDFKNDPLLAVSCVGDPMMPAFAGLVIGAAENVPVLMAGGTQMSAVLAVVNKVNPKILGNVAIGTTRWIVSDRTSDIRSIIAQIADVPILAANLNFSNSRYDGLKAYEAGVVKEGVGIGGTTIAAIAKSKGQITAEAILAEVEANYKQLVGEKTTQ